MIGLVVLGAGAVGVGYLLYRALTSESDPPEQPRHFYEVNRGARPAAGNVPNRGARPAAGNVPNRCARPEAGNVPRRSPRTTLYHYTDRRGYEGIERTGVIRASRFDQGRIVRFDEGVYLTSVPPSAGKYAAATACWGPNAAGAKIARGLVDYAFEISLPRNRVRKCHPVHDVHLFDDDIVRQTFPWTAYRLSF